MEKQNPRVVIVDDSPTSVSLYERSSSQLSIELVTFRSPTQSIDYLSEHDADLVFVDLHIREQDGIAFLHSLRALTHHQDTTVVIVTSKDYAQDRTLAKELGVLEYLVKPLRSQEISAIIQNHTGAQPRVPNA